MRLARINDLVMGLKSFFVFAVFCSLSYTLASPVSRELLSEHGDSLTDGEKSTDLLSYDSSWVLDLATNTASSNIELTVKYTSLFLSSVSDLKKIVLRISGRWMHARDVEVYENDILLDHNNVEVNGGAVTIEFLSPLQADDSTSLRISYNLTDALCHDGGDMYGFWTLWSSHPYSMVGDKNTYTFELVGMDGAHIEDVGGVMGVQYTNGFGFGRESWYEGWVHTHGTNLQQPFGATIQIKDYTVDVPMCKFWWPLSDAEYIGAIVGGIMCCLCCCVCFCARYEIQERLDRRKLRKEEARKQNEAPTFFHFSAPAAEAEVVALPPPSTYHPLLMRTRAPQEDQQQKPPEATQPPPQPQQQEGTAEATQPQHQEGTAEATQPPPQPQHQEGTAEPTQPQHQEGTAEAVTGHSALLTAAPETSEENTPALAVDSTEATAAKASVSDGGEGGEPEAPAIAGNTEATVAKASVSDGGEGGEPEAAEAAGNTEATAADDEGGGNQPKALSATEATN